MKLSRFTPARRAGLALGALVLTLGNSSCNVFDPFDKPSGDAQILSAARACFDQGDITCAQEYYSQLAGSTMADTAAAEAAFAILDGEGATMGAFIAAFASGGSGGAIAELANTLAARGDAGESKRDRVFQAFKKVSSITQPQTQGLVRFVTSVAVLAELFAEASGANHTVEKADYVSNPATCAAAALSGVGTTECDPVFFSNSSASIISGIESSANAPTGSPTMGFLITLIDQMQSGLNSIGASGSFSSGSGSFASAFDSLGGAGATQISEAINYQLLTLGIGE